MDESGNPANEEGASLEGLFRVLLELVFVWENTLGREFLNFRLTVVVPAYIVSIVLHDPTKGKRSKYPPVVDVRCPPHTEGTTSVNQCRNGVFISRGQNGLFVCLGSASFNARDEARADPNSLRTPGQVRGEAASVIHCAGTNDINWLPSKGGLVTLDSVDARRNEN